MAHNEDFNEEIGNNHIATSATNPLRADAFDKTDDEKIALIRKDVESILTTLGMDLTDDSMSGTPKPSSKNVCKRNFWRITSK